MVLWFNLKPTKVIGSLFTGFYRHEVRVFGGTNLSLCCFCDVVNLVTWEA